MAEPERPSPINFTFTVPFSVRASAGSMRPMVDVKLTSVPLCTGVPVAGVVVVPVPVPVDVVPAGRGPSRRFDPHRAALGPQAHWLAEGR